MKDSGRKWALVIAVAVLCGNAALIRAEDRAFAVFDTKKDRRLEIRQTSGRVFVTGTRGDTVSVRALRKEDKDILIAARGLSSETFAKPKEQVSDPRADGMRKLTHGDTGLQIDVERNQMWIATSSIAGNIELHVEVPRNVALDITTHFTDSVLVRDMQSGVRIRAQGAVAVEDIKGATEIESTSGWIHLRGVSGSVVASSQFGGIEGWILPSDAEHPISLSAMAIIDISLPQRAAATVHMKSTWGEVYTDFDMKLEPMRGRRSEAPTLVNNVPPGGKAGRVRVYEEDAVEATKDSKDRKEETVTPPSSEVVVPQAPMAATAPTPPQRSSTAALVGNINGGGVEIRLTTISGNIYVRKKQ